MSYICGVKSLLLLFVALSCAGFGARAQGRPLTPLTVGEKTYLVADTLDTARVYRRDAVADSCLLVVSKRDYRLYVYECVDGDTLLAAHYPVCYALFPEAKTGNNDMRTPECSLAAPFRVSEVRDASWWKHDFKDGRGPFLAYGAWFIRLDLSTSDCPEPLRANRSIGLHGSTGNRASVPGRDSEGCIRLRDEDLVDLRAHYVSVGIPVVVKGLHEGMYPFEVAAALGGQRVLRESLLWFAGREPQSPHREVSEMILDGD